MEMDSLRILTVGELKGSSVEIQGSDIFTMKEREFGIAPGTGYFRFVKRVWCYGHRSIV
jgi:hypothetical protein